MDPKSQPVESAPPAAQPVGRLLSVNVGMPKDVPWQGKTVFTGVFKDPVTGPRRVRRLNVDGDGQGDLAGHGGEQRAVFVYQLDSYRYWERELGRNDFVYGQFGENFTVDGLGDDEVCIGDRYRIGTAVFEVTQPRVTCYRVGIRMNDPRIPALLVSHHRPGFYFRVLEEGDVQAGDEIVKLASGPEQMPVAEVDALLYLPGHPRQQLLRALRIPALSPGWQASFRALLDGEPGSGNAGLAVDEPAARLARLPSADRHRDHPRERLGDLHPPRGPRRRTTPAARPASTSRCGSSPTSSSGRCCATTPSRGPPGAGYYRITVKREHDGAASGYLHTRLAVGDQLDVAAPRGTFILDRTHAPVLLISAGIGATPVLAMLQALAAGAFRPRDLVASRRTQQPRAPVRRRGPGPARLAAERAQPRVLQPSRSATTSKAATSTARAVSPRRYSPNSSRRATPRHTCAGPHLSWTRSAPVWRRWGSTPHASTPNRSARTGPDAGHRGNARAGAPPTRRPAGRRPDDRVRPQRPRDPWSSDYGSLLELAEACDVPVRWSCRTGVCHTCETTLIAGECRLQPRPGRTSRRRKRAHLLLTAPRRHRARPVTGVIAPPVP